MSRKPKKSMEEKLKIVQRCVAGKIGVREAGRVVGVDKSTIAAWVARYEAEGIEAFMPHEKNRVYDPAVKEAAVRDYLEGKGSYEDINYAQKSNFSTGSRCIMLMEISILTGEPEEDAT